MPGFYNNIMFSDNCDFSKSSSDPVGNITAAGQLFIGTGQSGVNPEIVGNTLTAGTGISITNGIGEITISSTSGGFPWTDISGAFSVEVQNGYFITGTATGTLPATPVQGDTVQFCVVHATQDLTIQASGTQVIQLGDTASIAGGTAVSTAQADTMELVYRETGNTWWAVDSVGSWDIT